MKFYEDAHKYKIEKDKNRKNEIIQHLQCKFIILKKHNIL